MKFDPPLLTRSALTNTIWVVTHGKITGHDAVGRPYIQASVKYDVTDQFDALVNAKDER